MVRNTLKLALCILIATASACAEVKLPAILADHMVLQRDMPLRIWGTASPGEKVAVDFNKRSATTTADPAGHWSVELPAMPAGGPYDLHVKGTNSVTRTDILLGDLWLAAGQSNMAQTLKAWMTKDPSDKSAASATDTDIRFFVADKVGSTTPLDDVKPLMPWTRCSPTSVLDFSALGYFFARNIRASEHVPIGVIDASWGETTAAIWINKEALLASPKLAPLITHPTPKAKRNGEERTGPGGTWNSIIHPIEQIRIKGVIWYQGSNDANDTLAPLYSETMKVLFNSWRKEWGEGDFPVILIQLGAYPNKGKGDAWPIARQAQADFLKLPNTAMEVSTDTRPLSELHDNHAVNKEILADRLTVAALAIAYHHPIEYMGPLYDHTTVEDSAIRVHFTHAKTLVAPTGKLEQFEVAGKDGVFVPADAKIDGSTILVSSPKVPKPAFARYEWVAVPSTSLYNGDKLPASPFNSQY